MSERMAQLAASLVDGGVGAVFGVPGSGMSWELLTALEARGVPFHGMAHEGAAAMAAGAYSRQAGRLGASLSIKGPGLANMLPGVLATLYEQWPAIAIAEAYGPARGGRAHKYLDQLAATRPFAKAYGRLGDPTELVPRLVQTARDEVPGPVHLDLCGEDAPVWEARDVQPPAAPVDVISDTDALRMIAGSRTPVVIVGAYARRAGWIERVEALRVPVFTTVAAKGAIDERRPWAAGVYTGDGKRLAPERDVLAKADAVVLLGVRAAELLGVAPFTLPAVAIDAVDGGLAATGARWLASSAADDLLDALSGREWGAEDIARALAIVREALLAPPWLPARVVAALEHRWGADAGMVVDTGSFCTIAEHVWRARAPWQFLASANGRFMGTGIPMAVGSVCAHGRPTICLVGDGGMRVGAAELKLAAAERWPLMVVLMRDGRYGSIAAGRGARTLAEAAVAIPQPSWWRAVDTFGCQSVEVHDETQLAGVIDAWRPDLGPLFVEAVFDPAPYETMTRDLR
jgi:acetolactate synthase-1/2/3 large subunit